MKVHPLLVSIAWVICFTGCHAIGKDPENESLKATGKVETGKMSWYSVKTNGGTTTASGEALSDTAYTAAHRTLPFGTRVKVTNLENKKTVVVRITDRGPFIKGRIIDVSLAPARDLDFVGRGVVACKIELLQ